MECSTEVCSCMLWVRHRCTYDASDVIFGVELCGMKTSDVRCANFVAVKISVMVLVLCLLGSSRTCRAITVCQGFTSVCILDFSVL